VRIGLAATHLSASAVADTTWATPPRVAFWDLRSQTSPEASLSGVMGPTERASTGPPGPWGIPGREPSAGGEAPRRTVLG